ncbi:MAG: PDZ domain-containing protein [Phycisphaerales bacterium]|nr:PDZ domain-containing protein [Planctomycetota bacterium]MCH8508075.1 PDZ domain-containing protein [Phycisphaerales bacterium]
MNRLTRSIVPTALIATLAGAAGAQFIAETTEDKGVRGASVQDSGASVQIVANVTDGRRTTVRIENGRVVHAEVDGQAWPAERVRLEGGSVLLLDEDGSVAQRIDAGLTPRPQIARIVTRGNFPDAPAPAPAPRVMLGITYSEPGEALRTHLGIGDTPALLVDTVVENLPAAKAGLKRHDLIVSINGSDGADAGILRKALADTEPGDTLELTVRRGGQTMTLRPELAAYDAAKLGISAPRAVPLVPGAPTPPARLRGFPELNFEIDPNLDEGDADRIREMLRARLGEMQLLFDGFQQDGTRRMLELRDGRVYIRSADEINRRVEELQRGMAERAPEIRSRIEDRVRLMEERMEHIERSFEARIERLAALLDRMADRLEQGADREEERKNP